MKARPVWLLTRDRRWIPATVQYVQLADEDRNLALDMVAARHWAGRWPDFSSRRFVAWG